jgi:hypothetical protein
MRQNGPLHACSRFVRFRFGSRKSFTARDVSATRLR